MAKQKISKKTLFITAGIIIVLAGILFVTEKTKLTNLIKTKQLAQTEAQSTSDSPSAKADFQADNTTKEPGDTRSETESDASVTDKKGNIGTAPTSSGISSASGEITVYSPLPNTEIKDSAEISGASSLSRVSYRLMDNINGVVATGELTVVNGKFAGTVSFSSSASEARLDLFGTKPDGTEFSNIEISLKVKR